jgi:peptide-methionine (S)-S-oxide reductase
MENNKIKTATLAAGCFWCVEAIFQQLVGVETVMSGYAGGNETQTTYKEVCTGQTGHAEVVQVVYKPSEISFEEILAVFFSIHDPTSLNKQGGDEGTQYRSSIFYHDAQQKQIAEAYINDLNDSGSYLNPIVTQLEPYLAFFPAEDYHQNYFNENGQQPYCHIVVKPKVEKFQKSFSKKLK